MPVQVEPDLIECDFGEWEGLTFAEVRERWPEQLDAWLASPAVAPPGGESFDAVLARVRSVPDPAAGRATPPQTVVVVSHVTPIKLILKDALAAGDAFLHRLFLDPAGVSLVDSWADGGVAVRTVNDTSHLAGLAYLRVHCGSFLPGLPDRTPSCLAPSTLYSDIVCAALPGAARRYLEELLASRTYEYQSDFVRRYVFQGRAEGRVEGRAEGEATALLAALAARRIDVPEDAHARITGCRDIETLTAWIRRAATAERIGDVLG